VVLRAQQDVLFSMLAAKVEHPPRGLLGGADGRAGALFLNGEPLQPGDGVLRAGDALTVETPGGAGLHPPHERPVERVVDDVQAGLVGLEAARAVYRVAIDPASLELDAAATAGLRAGAGR
jgi:N-methylhydantoinase B